jgi:hypothetical protein
LTFRIGITNDGPADAFGVTVDDGLSSVLDGFAWTCVATAPPTRCSRASGVGSITVDPGCTPDCSAGTDVSLSPILPVTGPELMPQAAGGLSLVAVGGLILLASRRRKRSQVGNGRSVAS